MAKKYYLLLLPFIINTLQAQEFIIKETPSVINVQYSSVAFADVNGDGFADVLVAGADGGYNLRSNLYFNDGHGNFTLSNNPNLLVIREGAAAFADIDNDGDQDLLITGITEVTSPSGSYGNRTKLYSNDGTGIFTEIQDHGIEAFSNSAMVFEDVDNDGDKDLIIAGFKGGSSTTNLYLNNGTGSFALANANINGLINIAHPAIALADIDNDGDKDLLLSGIDHTDYQIKMGLYKNGGSGTFTKVNNPGIEPIFTGGAVFGDIDNDGDIDLLMVGADPVYAKVAKLYTNDGTGTFTPVADTPFIGAQYGSVKLADVNNDGFKDVLITGYRNPNMRADLYMNNGSLGFTPAADMPFIGMSNSAFEFADVDNDADMDVLITGQNSPLGTLTKLYINQTNTLSAAERELVAVKLYPNPSGGKIRIALPEHITVNKIEVYDTTGKKVWTPQPASLIDITALPAAVYIVRIYTDKGILIRKIIKN